MPKAKIKLSSTNIEHLNEICDSIKDIATKTKVAIHGPIAMPTKKLKLTTRKSPCGDGKASFDNFEMRVHKRLIELGVDDRALRLIMRVQMPEEVQISISILD